MRYAPPLRLLAALSLLFAVTLASSSAHGAEALESGLTIAMPHGAKREASLDEAMALLNIPAVSVALIDQDHIAWVRAYGEGATPETLFQAASLSKLVAAVGALRLVNEKVLALDQDVNAKLTSWTVPINDLDRDHPVTLRGLLSMTGGIGVPGFIGYEVGTPLPTLLQILDGTPPANSPPVTVIAVPGSRYLYSGGGYEIAEALMGDAAGAPFAKIMERLVLKPAAMEHSTFAQPLPEALRPQAAAGHFGDGRELPGGFRVCPELAAAGLWSTPTDLARLLLLVGRAWRGESHLFLRPETAREMLTPQDGGPYGLGGAVSGAGGSLALMKRGQNVGYQGYLILFPATGQGMVVMTNSDNGSILAEALIRRAGEVYGWPSFGALAD